MVTASVATSRLPLSLAKGSARVGTTRPQQLFGWRQQQHCLALGGHKGARLTWRSRVPRAQQQQRAGSPSRKRHSSTRGSPVGAGAVSGAGDGYLTVLVYVTVKEGFEGDFAVASVDNARNSVQEPGVCRFDVLHSVEEPNKFVLVEVYKNEEAPAQHKETEHYLRWRETVAEMMAEPRTASKYYGCFPGTAHWEVPEALALGAMEDEVNELLAVHVFISVTPGENDAAAFQAASVANASASILEAGIARFDALQKDTDREDGVTEWMLNEVYLTPEAPAEHKETFHYALWRDTVAPLMHEPRSAKKYRTIFPRSAKGWFSSAY